MPTTICIHVTLCGKEVELVRVTRHTFNWPNETKQEMARRVWDIATEFALSMPVVVKHPKWSC